jgi:hypothetical protein
MPHCPARSSREGSVENRSSVASGARCSTSGGKARAAAGITDCLAYFACGVDARGLWRADAVHTAESIHVDESVARKRGRPRDAGMIRVAPIAALLCEFTMRGAGFEARDRVVARRRTRADRLERTGGEPLVNEPAVAFRARRRALRCRWRGQVGEQTLAERVRV